MLFVKCTCSDRTHIQHCLYQTKYMNLRITGTLNCVDKFTETNVEISPQIITSLQYNNKEQINVCQERTG